MEEVDFNEEEERKELKKYFKRVIKCSVCKHIYGSDGKKDNGLCPTCDNKFKQATMKKKKEVKDGKRTKDKEDKRSFD